ncbi:MAG: methyltransferase family protein [Spirochaetota bacterium]
MAMEYICAGAGGFLVLYWVDYAGLKNKLRLKRILWVTGTALLTAGVYGTCSSPAGFYFCFPVRLGGWAASGVFFILLFYSLCIEIPFKNAYIQSGSSHQVVTTGTYALVRHPGVLWFTGFLAGLFFISGSKTLLIAIPVWVGMDVLYVFIQEKYFFIKLFGDEYSKYQKEAPMLIPTSQSIRKCIKTFMK